MTEEENLIGDMTRTARLLLTAVGQFNERRARQQLERERDQQSSAAATEKAADIARREAIEAARSSYQDVSRWDWESPRIERQVGEAMVASTAMLEHDQVARVAQRRIVAEVRAHHGAHADEWMAAAIARWQELAREDYDENGLDADRAIEQERAEDRAEAAATKAADQARGQTHTDDLIAAKDTELAEQAATVEPEPAQTPRTEVERAVRTTKQAHPRDLSDEFGRRTSRVRTTPQRRANRERTEDRSRGR